MNCAVLLKPGNREDLLRELFVADADAVRSASITATCSSIICVQHLLVDAELPQQLLVDAAAELLRYACICEM